MGIIRDILDTVKDVSTLSKDSVGGAFTKRKFSSISRQSLEGTLQFPVVVSKSLDIDTNQMISKALERQYASFVQVTLTMNPTLDLSADGDAIGYLRKFHQNSNVKTGFNEFFTGVDKIMKENYTVYGDELNQKFLFAAVYEGSTPRLLASNREQLQTILEGIREDILNDKFIPRGPTYRFKDENLSQYHNQIVTEGKSGRDKQKDKRRQGKTVTHDLYRDEDPITMWDKEHSDPIPEPAPVKDLPPSPKETIKTETIKTSTVKAKGPKEPNKSNDPKNTSKFFELPKDVLKDNDVKKANELVPTTMHIRTILMNKENENQGTMDFIIGIKTTMHPVASDEMVTNVLSAVKNKSTFFNAIRWTTGEIGFFKDFLFNIKEIKEDVANRSAGASQWWIALKRRGALAKMTSLIPKKNQILPNATIVVSMEEVEYIKSHYGYDLMSPSFVNKIMGTYFLLGFVVVDNSTQIAHFLFDGQQDFQSVSFTGLEHETRGGGSSDIKEVLKLVQRI